MPLRSFKIWMILGLMLPCYNSIAMHLPTDSILQRYAADTCNSANDIHLFLVKFAQIPSPKILQQYKVRQAITRYHYILQQHPTDTGIVYCYVANNNFKAALPVLQQLEKLQNKDSITLQVACSNNREPLQFGRVIFESKSYRVKNIRLAKSSWNNFIDQPLVVRVDLLRKPSAEIIINTSNLITNSITLAQSSYPAVNGNRISVNVKEDLFDTTDIDLQGRFLATGNESTLFAAHALIMATLIGGAGNSGDKGKGVATAVSLSSSDFNSTLLPDEMEYYQKYLISLQNYSYGTSIENFYGAEAAAYDQQSYLSDTVLHIFSSGNVGNTMSAAGLYTNLNSYANLSGNFKQAKNVLVVGGTAANSIIIPLSSRGPAYDGRIKPELVAYGEDGTSGAAAITTGVAALVQDAWQQKNDNLPPAALVRAILINSANRPQNTGPSFSNGYGSLNAAAALAAVQSNLYFQGTVSNGQHISFNIAVPEGMGELRITGCWTDPPAPVNASMALVNDLDLTATVADQIWQPWILNSFPAVDSLSANAKRGEDHINNTEQISIPNPSGIVNLEIKGSKVNGTQRFFIVYSFIPKQSFQWLNPANNVLQANETIPLQWTSTYPGNGEVSCSLDAGQSWTSIASNIPLSQGILNWITPDTLAKAIVKLTVTDTSFLSNSFIISPRPVLATGLNCEDTVLLHWNPVPGANSYQVFVLDNQQLSAFRQVNDTSILIQKEQLPGRHLAVAPLTASGEQGLKSYTIEYAQQGVACYINNLLADKTTDKSVLLSLTLGSVYNLTSIEWERYTSGNWQALQGVEVDNQFHLNYLDEQVPEGIIYYRVKLVTSSGAAIYSNAVSVTIFNQQKFILFPNPAYSNVTLLHEAGKSRQVVIRDMSGRAVLQRTIAKVQEVIPLQQLAVGIYNFSVYENGVLVFSKQFVKL